MLKTWESVSLHAFCLGLACGKPFFHKRVFLQQASKWLKNLAAANFYRLYFFIQWAKSSKSPSSTAWQLYDKQDFMLHRLIRFRRYGIFQFCRWRVSYVQLGNFSRWTSKTTIAFGSASVKTSCHCSETDNYYAYIFRDEQTQMEKQERKFELWSCATKPRKYYSHQSDRMLSTL